MHQPTPLDLQATGSILSEIVLAILRKPLEIDI
jgi:hypothetical protein